MSFSTAQAHEVVPAIADLEQDGRTLMMSIRLPLEGFVTGMDFSSITNTNEAPDVARYDMLRAMPPAAFAEEVRAFWPEFASGFALKAEGARLEPELTAVQVIPNDDLDFARDSVVSFSAELPAGAESVTFFWPRVYGDIVIRQQGVEAPFTGMVEGGTESPPITLTGGDEQTGLQAFASYVPVGFRHILPLGLDHILFVLGLFLLSTQWRPLLAQVTTFTVAHTITLALAALGIVSVPASIVEPLIAASIIFVAVENIFTTGLSRWRPFVVFGFGLLHGLGFASVLGEFGLPENAFIPALIGFNVGVELGQLTVIAAAYAAVGFWFGNKPWYHRVVTIPASLAIAVIAAWWVLERTIL